MEIEVAMHNGRENRREITFPQRGILMASVFPYIRG